MPSLSQYRLMLHDYGNTSGEAKKIQSARIIEETWFDDVSAKHAYVYDYYHDKEPLKLKGLKPRKDKNKLPLDIKYIIASSQTYDKDEITYHIQLKPNQKCNVPYYDKMFGRYDATFPVGLYIDIPDEKGVYNKWLVVGKANSYDPMIPTFHILPCNKIIQYIYENKKYQIAGVLRSQNSYNSGVWTDYLTTSVEDQQKFIVPLNDETECIYYNQRMIIDNYVKTEPRAWVVSKVNRLNSFGLDLVTLAQDKYNEHTDYIEYDLEGNIIGMWADYYSSNIPPTDWQPDEPNFEILYSGASPTLKVGGSYKKFTVSPSTEGAWTYTLNSQDANELLKIITIDDGVKIKFIGDDTYIGEILNITFTSATASTTLDVEILSL